MIQFITRKISEYDKIYSKFNFEFHLVNERFLKIPEMTPL